jgi:alkylation response protein AidB-like acyl-CoA dehydrogenase
MDFAEAELWPFAAEWDEKKHFPMDVYKRAADLGFAAIYVSEEGGGCGLGRLDASLIFEALSTGSNFPFRIPFRMCTFISVFEYSQYVRLDD